MLVLVAHPDAEVQAAAAEALVEFGYRFIQATSSEDIQVSIAFQPPDVAFISLDLPALALGDICIALRGNGHDSRCYVVVMTSVDDAEGLRAAMLAGADDVLLMPLAPEQLHVRLQVAERFMLLQRQVLDQRAELYRVGRALSSTARTDALTQLGNARQLLDDLGLFHGQLRRYGHRFAAARLDLDRLTKYAAVYGQLASDEALRVVAEITIQCLRTGDRAYRCQGAEIVVLFPEQTAESARIAVDRIREALADLRIPHAANEPWRVLTLSAGIVAYGGNKADADLARDQLLDPTQAALDQARQTGGNQVIVEERRQSP